MYLEDAVTVANLATDIKVGVCNLIFNRNNPLPWNFKTLQGPKLSWSYSNFSL